MVVGYVCAAAAFAVALFAGWRLLSHERPADEPSKAPELGERCGLTDVRPMA